MLCDAALEAVVDGEVHSPVGEQGHQGGGEPPVEAAHALLIENLREAACSGEASYVSGALQSNLSNLVRRLCQRCFAKQL